MSAEAAAVGRTPAQRLWRGLGLALLAVFGLLVGAVVGLFVADWVGWVPQLFAC